MVAPTDAEAGNPFVRVAVAYHSGYGHTAKQAEAVANGACSVRETEVRLLSVADLSEEFWDILADADAIMFGAPTYMGGPSAEFKAFADASSRVWFAGQTWKDKIAAGFTNSGGMSGDKLNTLVSLSILAAQHGMHWINLGMPPGWNSSGGSAEDLNRLGSSLGAMAQSNVDQGPEIVPPESDLQTGYELGVRVAMVTRQLMRGREPGLAPSR